jgi:hypothetical protein
MREAMSKEEMNPISRAEATVKVFSAIAYLRTQQPNPFTVGPVTATVILAAAYFDLKEPLPVARLPEVVTKLVADLPGLSSNPVEIREAVRQMRQELDPSELKRELASLENTFSDEMNRLKSVFREITWEAAKLHGKALRMLFATRRSDGELFTAGVEVVDPESLPQTEQMQIDIRLMRLVWSERAAKATR